MSEHPKRRKEREAKGLADAHSRIEAARRNGAIELKLSGLALQELPESLGQLTQLQALNLSHNQFTTLPTVIYQLNQLKYLSIAANGISKISNEISSLTQLERFFLGRNRLTQLPRSMSALKNLRVLSIADNLLNQLPEWIDYFQHLECLDITNTGTVVIYWYPDSWSIADFSSQLSSNTITRLPEALRKLSSLKELYLHGNDKLDLPIEIIGPRWIDVAIAKGMSEAKKPANPKDILDYYFRTRGGKRPLNEAKLILVGRGGVGKTSLVNRLVRNTFDKDEQKTDGIQITHWRLRLNDNEAVRLNVWDFGGQEIMHATHQFFLTQRSLYVLVLNGREGGADADAEYWLKLIESFGGESPVIVVLNKIEEQPFDLNRRALQQKYPNIREFIKTDCASSAGIAELSKAIERETDRLEHLRDAFPASWFTIKDRLADMGKNYVDFDAFRELCRQHGEQEEDAQELLAGYLHNLGIVLNYKDDPRLEDTHVLSPHWVTSGIYNVLNAPKLEQQHGEIRLNDLAQILDRNDYPAQMRRFIFDLMRKFDLCFSFPDDDTHYLIPELLDKQEPAETAAFKPDECLNFQYHYPILPEGLLPRFIVRTHTLSEGLARWRTGAILQFEGNRALVKADVQDKQVFIAVTGPMAGRRRLLAVIRSEFERIHRDIRNLQPQEMIPLPDHPDTVVSYHELLIMEQQGIKTFPKVVQQQVIAVDVQALLNGVDLDNTRRRERSLDRHEQAVRLFYSYSHKDEHLRDELETHLKLLQRQGLIETWHDRRIEAGDDWRKQIDHNLERADIVLLLISADFIASDYCYEQEMERALERHRRGAALVIPVIVRDVNWQSSPLSELQALPKDGLAVTKWADRDSAWRNVEEGIRRVAEELNARQRR